MKRTPFILLTVTLLFFPAAYGQTAGPIKPEKLPSVDKILDKYVKAIGGRSVVQKQKVRFSVGTLELSPMNLKGTFESYAAAEARSYSKMSITGIGDMIETTDGKTAWSANPIQGNRERSGAELVQTKLVADFYRDIRLKTLYPKMELKGVEKMGGKDAYVITAAADGIQPETWYFDKESGLLVRSDMTLIAPEGSHPISVFYEDHRKVDGIMIPYRVRTQAPSFQITMSYTEVKHAVAVDDAKFTKPKI